MKAIVGIFTFLFLFSCGNKEKENGSGESSKKTNKTTDVKIELKDLSFMEGNWEDISGTFEGFKEKWIKMGDSLFQIVGYTINESDTIISEVIKVKYRKGILNYIPRVLDQNEGKEISFGLSSGSTIDSFAFVNYNHDFPREIIYVKKGTTKVAVYLNGVSDKSEEVKLKLVLSKTN